MLTLARRLDAAGICYKQMTRHARVALGRGAGVKQVRLHIMQIGQDGVGFGDIHQGGKGSVAEGEFVKLRRDGTGLRPAN